MPDRQRRVSALAGRQKGNLTRRQLLALGVGAHKIDAWLKSGLLIAKFRGVYRLGHEAVPEFSDELAAVMACGPGAWLCRRSAAYLWRLLPRSPSTRPVSILLVGRQVRSRPGIEVHRTRSLPRADTTVHDGVPATNVARTLIDLAASASLGTVEQALNEAHALRLVTSPALLSLLARHPRSRGSRGLRTLINPAGHEITRSEAERRLLALIRAARLPAPRVNQRLGRFEVDFVWSEQRLVVEVDGFRFHSSRTAFERDRVRDAALAGMGYTVVRITWRRIVDEPYAVVADISGVLARASALS